MITDTTSTSAVITYGPLPPLDPSRPPSRTEEIESVHRATRSLRQRLTVLHHGNPELDSDEPRFVPRVWWGPCTRCGYVWLGRVLGTIAPQCCARCHSSGWRKQPTGKGARTPDAEPNPNWVVWHGRSDREKREARDRRRKTVPTPVIPDPLPMSAEAPALTPPPVLRVSDLAPTAMAPPPRLASLSDRLRRVTSEPRGEPTPEETIAARHVPGTPFIEQQQEEDDDDNDVLPEPDDAADSTATASEDADRAESGTSSSGGSDDPAS